MPGLWATGIMAIYTIIMAIALCALIEALKVLLAPDFYTLLEITKLLPGIGN